MSLTQPSHTMLEGTERSTLGGFQPFLVSVLTTSLCPNGAEITEGRGRLGNISLTPSHPLLLTKGRQSEEAF